MRRLPPALALLVGVLVCCGPLASCTTSKQPGELMVLVTTDLSVPKDIDTLRVNVTLSGGRTLLNNDYPLGPTGLILPGTLGVVPGPKTTAPVTIQVSGLLQGVTRVSREAIVTLPTDRVAMLPMPLDWLCIGPSCMSGQTCQAGACVSAKDATIANNDVPPSASDGGPNDGGSACFDTTACFESAVGLWLAPLRADCTIPKPTGGAGVNVALVVRGGGGICGSTSCLVPLDAESAEGWQTSLDGARLELPLAVCANREITAVEVTTACRTKRANVAICPGGASAPNTNSACTVDADGGCPDGYVCELSGGQPQCVLSSDGGTSIPKSHCVADSTLVCEGNATGYSCAGMPDPWLQCDRVHDRHCSVSWWCCVPAGDAGACTVDAGAAGPLIEDMSGEDTGSICAPTQNKLPIGPGIGMRGYWYVDDDRTGAGSMIPPPGQGFNYTPVAAACSAPFSNAACMKSVTPYRSASPNGWAVMGFNFVTSGTNLDGGTSTPVPYPVTAYKGIGFWAMASDTGSQSVSVQFSDVQNDQAAPGHACGSVSPPAACYNFHQSTLTVQSAWRPYEVDFDGLTQLFTSAQGYYTTAQFDQSAALGIQFLVGSDGVRPLTFDVCVADIRFVPK